MGALAVAIAVVVDIAHEGLKSLEGAAGGGFGSLPGVHRVGNFSRPQETFGGQPISGCEIRMSLGIQRVTGGGGGIFTGAMLLDRPFELCRGLRGRFGRYALVQCVRCFRVLAEQHVGQDERLGGGAGFFREDGEDFGVGLIQSAIGHEGFGRWHDGLQGGQRIGGVRLKIAARQRGQQGQ